MEQLPIEKTPCDKLRELEFSLNQKIETYGNFIKKNFNYIISGIEPRPNIENIWILLCLILLNENSNLEDDFINSKEFNKIKEKFKTSRKINRQFKTANFKKCLTMNEIFMKLLNKNHTWLDYFEICNSTLSMNLFEKYKKYKLEYEWRLGCGILAVVSVIKCFIKIILRDNCFDQKYLIVFEKTLNKFVNIDSNNIEQNYLNLDATENEVELQIEKMKILFLKELKLYLLEIINIYKELEFKSTNVFNQLK